MTKHILTQYNDLQEEIKDLGARINKTENQIQKIKSEGTVKDSVTGGYGGIQHFEIEGMPYPEYSKKRTRLFLYKAQLENAELELLEITKGIEEYIQSVDDSRQRRIMRLRYVDKKTWIQIGHLMNATADSVRMEHNRFLGI